MANSVQWKSNKWLATKSKKLSNQQARLSSGRLETILNEQNKKILSVKKIAEEEKEMYIYVPKKSVGPFSFGKDISIYIKDFTPSNVLIIDRGPLQWECYEFENFKLELWVQKGKIKSINCYKHLIFDNVDLFKFSTTQLLSYCNSKDSVADLIWLKFKKKQREVFDIDNPLLQVWSLNDKVEQIIVSKW